MKRKVCRCVSVVLYSIAAVFISIGATFVFLAVTIDTWGYK
jgi:hypothetical protein